MTLRRIAIALAACAAAAAGGLAGPATARADTPASYVALGDSYTSGPLILPISPSAPLDCLQSAENYPHLTAAALGLSLSDVSCAGADTSNMTTAQFADQPPQFDALTASTRVVTLGIGGNDNSTFLTALAGCSAIDGIAGAGSGDLCALAYGNKFADQIAADETNVAGALQHIHTLSPAARVFVVGYPDILPQSGSCFSQMPITTADVAYLNGVELDLNAMLRTAAGQNGATYVDTYGASVGHDSCQGESTRWVEPLLPSTDAVSAHPNAAGEAADARAVEAAIG
ncbi:SGNH/GDSL hydrolase family protein [Streptantibioticus silvisoli]|uniref:SGNH/GDSL hydrolase family protein n=1 Tax=Streptantibioticus silvisoli TaxID=2705255 RepID=A0ABT6W498_9ACTN|nr:SGNH/GDSL hydrolase family protein [Streptantibioticus silvisoli]MDI5965564.1 SGNH/GDSL hydrolase family protein [Streptantibioticus silvisoli]